MSSTTVRRAVMGAVVTTATLVSTSTSAFATTVTTLDRAAFLAELSTVAKVTAASEQTGWRQALSFTVGSGAAAGSAPTPTATTAYDPTTQRVLETTSGLSRTDTTIAQVGRGTWTDLSTDSQTTAELKLLGRPGATYVLDPSWSAEVASVRKQAGSTQIGDVPTSVTSAVKTVEDDGTITYAVTETDPGTGTAGPVTAHLTIHTAADGVLLGESFDVSEPASSSSASSLNGSVTITYGPQTIDVPAASDTVSKAALNRAINAINLRSIVSMAGDRVARASATMARHAHRTIVPADIVLAARQVVKGAPVHITVTAVKGGVRLSSVNPFTHATVSSTVVVELAAVVHTG